MGRNAQERQLGTGATAISALIARVVERELSRSRAARLRAVRRRADAQRARQFERQALVVVRS